MKGFHSIRARFTGWYLVVLAILLIAMSIGIYWVLRETLVANVDEAITRRANELMRQPDFAARMLDDSYLPPLGEVIGLAVPSGDGWETFGIRVPDALSSQSEIDNAAAGKPSFVTLDSGDAPPIRYLLVRYTPQEPPPSDLPSPEVLRRPERVDLSASEVPAFDDAVLIVGQPTDAIISALGALRGTLLLAVPLTLLLSAGGGLFLIRRALQPVDRMTATTRSIEETDLAQRVSVQSDDELGRLGRTLNSMLSRLEEAFARQRQFTDDASHELRTPLSVIEAEATLALRRERPAEQYREALSTIAEEATSMHRLVDQLLSLARGDALDREHLQTEILDLGVVVSDVAAALGPLAQEREIALSTQTTPVRIAGDPVRIRRLVVNLMDNAIRYTEPGGDVTAILDQESDHAVLRVRDTGVGIAPEHLDTVFERFVRLDSSRLRTGDTSGSGLGLAICRQIVSLHGGEIAVDSTLGQGSTFTVRLRRSDV